MTEKPMVKKHTPEQWARINAFLKKADAEHKLPPSYFAHVHCEIELSAWEAFGCLKAEFMSINPVVTLKYLLTKETPEVSPTKDMRKCASRALIEVAKLGQVERGRGIIKDLGADVNDMDTHGHTPLYHAIARKRLGMAEMLLQNGADAYRQRGDTLGALNLACAMGFVQAIPLFIKYGADINQPTGFKSWRKFHMGYQVFYAHPLSIAISQNQPKVCQVLLDKGARLDLNIRKGFTIRDFVNANWDDFSAEMKSVFAPIVQAPQKTEVAPVSQTREVSVVPPEVTPLTNNANIGIQVDIVAEHRETKVTPEKITQKTVLVHYSETELARD